MAAFDWYQATIHHPLDDVLEALMTLDEGAVLRHEKGAHGYAHSVVIEGVDGQVARVWHGGSHEYPHALLTGEAAQPGAECIRAHFPAHLVTRADAREDFGDVGAFDRMLPSLLTVADQHKVRVDTRGDHLLTKQARTVYLGAPSSACRLRLYDKAAELRSKFAADPVRLAEVPNELARLEAQVRPQTRQAREQFATIEPLAVMGSSGWLRALWKLVSDMDLNPVQVGKPWRQSDDDRAYAYMLAQYGGLIRRRILEHGSPECFGLQLASDLAEREKAKRNRGR